MLRSIRRILLIALLLIHLAIVALWWDSWRFLRYYIGPKETERAGISSGFGMVIVNIRGTAIYGLDPRDERAAGLFSIPINAWTDSNPDSSIYIEPLSTVGTRTELKRHFSAEVVRNPVYTPGPYHSPSTKPRTLMGIDRYLRICFPYWFAAVVSGAVVWPWIGWIAFRRRRARRRDRAGLCPKCGYDIRANPTRCSECGYETAVITG